MTPVTTAASHYPWYHHIERHHQNPADTMYSYGQTDMDCTSTSYHPSGARDLKKSRILNACQACRHRKVRCSGGHPCELCARLHKKCEYRKVTAEENAVLREKKRISKLRKHAEAARHKAPHHDAVHAFHPYARPSAHSTTTVDPFNRSSMDSRSLQHVYGNGGADGGGMPLGAMPPVLLGVRALPMDGTGGASVMQPHLYGDVGGNGLVPNVAFDIGAGLTNARRSSSIGSASASAAAAAAAAGTVSSAQAYARKLSFGAASSHPSTVPRSHYDFRTSNASSYSSEAATGCNAPIAAAASYSSDPHGFAEQRVFRTTSAAAEWTTQQQNVFAGAGEAWLGHNVGGTADSAPASAHALTSPSYPPYASLHGHELHSSPHAVVRREMSPRPAHSLKRTPRYHYDCSPVPTLGTSPSSMGTQLSPASVLPTASSSPYQQQDDTAFWSVAQASANEAARQMSLRHAYGNGSVAYSNGHGNGDGVGYGCYGGRIGIGGAADGMVAQTGGAGVWTATVAQQAHDEKSWDGCVSSLYTTSTTTTAAPASNTAF